MEMVSSVLQPQQQQQEVVGERRHENVAVDTVVATPSNTATQPTSPPPPPVQAVAAASLAQQPESMSMIPPHTTVASVLSNNSTAAMMGRTPGTIPLQPYQSITIHGWMNPKWTLTWNDVMQNDGITVRMLVTKAGITQVTCCFCGFLFGEPTLTHTYTQTQTQQQLRRLQPDVTKWIKTKNLSFSDVPYMLEFPLHPITHLGGNIATLIDYQYPPEVLQKLRITYRLLKEGLYMNTQWMMMFHFTLAEWQMLGFTRADLGAMDTHEIMAVFESDRKTVDTAMRFIENSNNLCN